MLSKKLQKALNNQIREELASGYLYFAMSSWFKAGNLDGFARWLGMQAQEEFGHAMKIYSFLHDRDGDVELQTVEAPPKSWKSPLEAFQDALKHEQHITGKINELVDLARQENDNATLVLLNWFVEEQVEEEASAQEVVEKLKMVGDAPSGVYLINKEMESRGGE